MSDNRKRILDMLDARKITVDEAMKLLDAVEKNENSTAPSKPDGRTIKYLRVMIDSPQGFKDEHGHRSDGPAKVNVRVPVGLIRAGMKFTALLPKEASDQIDAELKKKGVSFNIRNLKDSDIEELIQALAELEVDIEGGDRVRVFAE